MKINYTAKGQGADVNCRLDLDATFSCELELLSVLFTYLQESQNLLRKLRAWNSRFTGNKDVNESLFAQHDAYVGFLDSWTQRNRVFDVLNFAKSELEAAPLFFPRNFIY